ncbi:MAG: hypothetical protein FD170_3725 [Bacteroidetes bacterium]|nr:MAG: hypothetical protein FD170_3725 [Bacteroidota bacterium]
MNRNLHLPVKLASLLILIALLVMPGVGWGQTVTLAGWDFNGLSAYGPSPMAPANSASNLTIAGLTRGSGITTTPTAAGSAWGGNGMVEATEASAITGNDFIYFSIAANTGYTVSINSINAYNVRRSSTGPTTGQWQYQIGSGSFTDIGSDITWGSTTSSAGNAQAVISLSGISALQNVAAGTTVTFRCILWSGSAAGGTWYLNNFQTGNDFVLDGTVSSATTPTLTVTPTSLTNFTYALGAGPSAEQSFAISGSNLIANVSIDAPLNYEISTGTGGGFTAADPITLSPSSGTLSETTIYVRLKAGLVIGDYNSEVITATSTDADPKTVTCSGNVYDQIDWCNLQWPLSGEITLGDAYTAYGQVWMQGVTLTPGATTGLQAWLGYSTSNTNPNTWTNWIPASFSNQVGENDEYLADLGAALSAAGTYYYAYRYQYNSAPSVYGDIGGFWNNNSGVLTVNPPTAQIDWCNLQWPVSGSITAGGTFEVYAQVYEPGVTNSVGQGAGISAWIGYSTANTDPSTWTNWVVASFNGDAGNNDEYMANIATGLAPGTYYYASRFKYGLAEHVYGGYSSGGGGFWDNSENVSGVLTVNAPPIPNAWINEFHYDDDGTDENEFVEVVVENASGVNLSELRIHLYNGNGGAVYGTSSLNTYIAGVTSNNFTIYSLAIPGIQNGAPDGFALSYYNILVPGQFLSYEGTFEATDGPAIGVTSVDIGVSENGTGAATNSLQLGGAGTSYSAFFWQPEASNTLGFINNNQSFFASTTWTGAGGNGWEFPAHWTNGVPVPGSIAIVPVAAFIPAIVGNAACGSLTIDNGAGLIIGSTGTLTVTGNMTTANNVYIYDGGSLITNGTVTGTATVQKNINDADFHLFTLPVNQSLPASPTFIGYYVDDYIEANGEWTRLVDADNLQPLRGYSIANESGAVSLEFSGSLFTGNQLFPGLSYTPAAGGYLYGWNLVGNPFPSAIDMDVAALTSTGLNGFAYVWNGSNYVSGPLLGGVGTLTDNVIPSAQGFFVRTEAAGASLTIPNTARVHSSQAFYKNSQTFENTIMLTASGNGAEDRMMFAVNPEASAGYDSNLDAYKLFGNADAPQLYTTFGEQNYSISTVDVIEADTEFPVMFTAGADGNYTITASFPESFMTGSPINLTDLLTGLRQDLRQNPVYAFNASVGDDANRFKLSFATLGIGEQPGLNIGVYAVDGQIRLLLPEAMKGTVNITNLSGQALYSRNFSASGELGINASFPAGVYLVSVVTAQGTATRKVFVN